MKKIIRIDENKWARCGKCGHKLFKMNSDVRERDTKIALNVLNIEIKCSSCKELNILGGTYDD